MPRCALCQEVLPTKLKLVQHFSDAHSIARQRQRRSKVPNDLRYVTTGTEGAAADAVEDQEGGDFSSTQNSSHQTFRCLKCESEFATEASLQDHHCGVRSAKKRPVACQYCGQICKDRRGAAIHQAFCESKSKEAPDLKVMHVPDSNVTTMLDGSTAGASTMYECPSDDCGAMFKTEDHLVKHIERHHFGEGISIYRGNTPPRSPPSRPEPAVPKPTEPPLVTVTMKPHIGKTEGLQDLSLLINPTKNGDTTPDYSEQREDSPSMSRDAGTDTTSITVEVLNTDGLTGNREAVLYVAEDGTVLQASQGTSQADDDNKRSIGNEEEGFVIISGSDGHKSDLCRPVKCSICRQYFLNKDFLKTHIASKHSHIKDFSNLNIKSELLSDEDEQSEDAQNNEDEDWELISFCKEGARSENQSRVRKRHYLSESGYQAHVKNKDCKNKKLKLPRMFSCHFKNCDSSFFKLTELQKHWQIAHKFKMASKNLEFEDERSFTDWLAVEEDKHKVRFTSDVKRRKPHRTERLLVCHRFHNLRSAAARKNANKQYSDRHNWIHKIQPCLCYARMKVYQAFNEETCDYTGKITVVYYYEHSHPKDEYQGGKEDIINHVLQRNKRNRTFQFQDLKGSEKMMHRQKLEKLAHLAGKEYQSCVKTTRPLNVAKKSRRRIEVEDSAMNGDEDQMAAVQVANNLLESDELFATQVEMVLDGQFDMGPEVLSGQVVTHLDSLPIFSSGKVEPVDHGEANVVQIVEEAREESTVQAVLPASTADWGKLFDLVRTRVSSEDNDALHAEAALVLPYEKVIELISPSEQIPIFRQLWELAYPSSSSKDGVQFEIDI